MTGVAGSSSAEKPDSSKRFEVACTPRASLRSSHRGVLSWQFDTRLPYVVRVPRRGRGAFRGGAASRDRSCDVVRHVYLIHRGILEWWQLPRGRARRGIRSCRVPAEGIALRTLPHIRVRRTPTSRRVRLPPRTSNAASIANAPTRPGRQLHAPLLLHGCLRPSLAVLALAAHDVEVAAMVRPGGRTGG